MSTRNTKPRIPSLCLHKPTGQGYVTIEGRFRYLGRYDSAQTVQAYHRLIAECLAGGSRRPDGQPAGTGVSGLTGYRLKSGLYLLEHVRLGQDQ